VGEGGRQENKFNDYMIVPAYHQTIVVIAFCWRLDSSSSTSNWWIFVEQSREEKAYEHSKIIINKCPKLYNPISVSHLGADTWWQEGCTVKLQGGNDKRQ
jgi:hypothetical protein